MAPFLNFSERIQMLFPKIDRHAVGGMVQVVGLTPGMLAPPSAGGATTPAHSVLITNRILPPQIVANLTAPAAAAAATVAQQGGSSDQAAAAADGVNAAMQATGQTQISQGPQEVPMRGNGPREFPMGFGLTAIAAGAQQIINANPQVNFRPSRLVIPDNVAPSFMVNDFKIGMRSQLVAPGALPAASFTEKAVGTAMSLDTVNVGQFVTLDVTNVSTQAANFTASLFGTTLDS